jgi:hypothetical protein
MGIRLASDTVLLSGVRGLLTCDRGEVVQGIVDFVVSQRRWVQWLCQALRGAENTPLATAVMLVNALRCYTGVSTAGDGDIIVAARRPNERRAVAELIRVLADRRWTEIVFRWRLVTVAQGLARLTPTLVRDGRRTARLAKRVRRRYGVFAAVRVLELLAYYRRYGELFAHRRYRLAVMSSHSNPHGIALNLAARHAGVPVALVTHGMPISPIARLHYELAVHECDASRLVYADAGCRMDAVVIKSRRRDSAPMRPLSGTHGLTAGAFLSKDPVPEQVMSCLHALLADRRIAKVLVRPHPVNLWRGLAHAIASLDPTRVQLQSSNLLTNDLMRCDLVVAGNSTVLLDSVVAGRPACYVRGFDHGPYDVQSFVRDGLVYELTDVRAIDYDAITSFYVRPEWPRVLSRYADIDRDHEAVAADVRAAVRALIGSAPQWHDRSKRGRADQPAVQQASRP